MVNNIDIQIVTPKNGDYRKIDGIIISISMLLIKNLQNWILQIWSLISGNFLRNLYNLDWRLEWFSFQKIKEIFLNRYKKV